MASLVSCGVVPGCRPPNGLKRSRISIPRTARSASVTLRGCSMGRPKRRATRSTARGCSPGRDNRASPSHVTLGQVSDLSAVLRRFPGRRILVIGDVILDRYWWGEASRLSPEAPVPVVRKQSATVRPGGAANTAANLAALGATPLLVGLVGQDPAATELYAALLACDVRADWLVTENARPTTTKTRIIASHQQIVRVDEEEVLPTPREVEERALEVIAECLERCAAVVVSDYAKGFLTPSLLKFAIGQSGARRQARFRRSQRRRLHPLPRLLPAQAESSGAEHPHRVAGAQS